MDKIVRFLKANSKIKIFNQNRQGTEAFNIDTNVNMERMIELLCNHQLNADAIIEHLVGIFGESYISFSNLDFLYSQLENGQEEFNELPYSILIFSPTEEYNFFTLATVGLSNYQMSYNPTTDQSIEFTEEITGKVHNPSDISWPEAENRKFYGELIMAIGNDFSMPTLANPEISGHPDFQWLARVFVRLVSFPHHLNTFIWHGHLMPLGDLRMPSNPNYSNIYIDLPIFMEQNLMSCVSPLNPDEDIHFLGVYPIYDEEIKLKMSLNSDSSEFFMKLVEAGAPLFRIQRKPAV